MLNKYYGSKIEDEIIMMWAVDLLEEFNYEDIQVAIKSYKQNEIYNPTLAGIIKYIPKRTIDYARIVRETVQKYDNSSERGRQALKENPIALDLYNRYGSQVGNSEPYSTAQKFLFKEINDEAEQKIKYNTTTIDYLESKYTYAELSNMAKEKSEEEQKVIN